MPLPQRPRKISLKRAGDAADARIPISTTVSNDLDKNVSLKKIAHDNNVILQSKAHNNDDDSTKIMSYEPDADDNLDFMDDDVIDLSSFLKSKNNSDSSLEKLNDNNYDNEDVIEDDNNFNEDEDEYDDDLANAADDYDDSEYFADPEDLEELDNDDEEEDENNEIQEDNNLNNKENNDKNDSDNSSNDNAITDDNTSSIDNAHNSNNKSNGFSGKLGNIFARMKSEIGGDNNDDDENAPDINSEKENDNPPVNIEPTKDNKNNNAVDKSLPSGNSKQSPLASIIKLIVGILKIPFKILKAVFITGSIIIRVAFSLSSLIVLYIIVWLCFNVPLAINTNIMSFDEDEGTLSAQNISYKNNSVILTAVNNSDMISHANVSGKVYGWKPFSNIPSSLIMSDTMQTCSAVDIDLNPGESKQITLSCSGTSGIWMRPSIILEGN